MILGCDAAGVTDDGREVIVHSVIGSGADETLDPARTLLSEKYQGTFADYLVVPAGNVIDRPSELTDVEAACLPTAWLTAYRMLVTRGQLQPGETILVQGVGGGVSTACIVLGKALGLRVWATSRSTAKRDQALDIGADAVFDSGTRLPERVQAVMETVGAATWEHSIRSLVPGGRIVISGATSGANPPAELTRIFFKQLSVIGSTMGTKAELVELMELCLRTGVRPLIDQVRGMDEAAAALAQVESGDIFGKIVLTR
jgi:NADPH:quinone reductase-like Zn-dependent oxidoreductase